MFDQPRRIASFTVDHTKLLPGIYLSREYRENNTLIRTFDLRLIRPNTEPCLDQAGLHTIEHLGATFLRTISTVKDQVIYFGPMGCRTGFYMILANVPNSVVKSLVIAMFEFIRDFQGEIPGAKIEECGNYLEHNLTLAKVYATQYLGKITKNCPTQYSYL